MSAPINLNKARKEKNRASRKVRADENSVKFGQTKAQKDAQKTSADNVTRAFEAHKRET
jgi:hypothetical protein